MHIKYFLPALFLFACNGTYIDETTSSTVRNADGSITVTETHLVIVNGDTTKNEKTKDGRPIAPQSATLVEKHTSDYLDCVFGPMPKNLFANIKDSRLRNCLINWADRNESRLFESGYDADRLVAQYGAVTADTMILNRISQMRSSMDPNDMHQGCLAYNLLYYVRSGNRIDIRIWNKEITINMAYWDFEERVNRIWVNRDKSDSSNVFAVFQQGANPHNVIDGHKFMSTGDALHELAAEVETSLFRGD